MPKPKQPRKAAAPATIDPDSSLPKPGDELDGGGSPKRRAFLAAMAQTGLITAAAHAAKVSINAHSQVWMKQPGYPELFAAAKEQAVEMMEAEALRRATIGSPEPVFHAGKQCGTVTKKSDVLLIFLLKAARPEKYRDRMAHELSGPKGGPIPFGTVTDAMRAQADAMLADPEAAAALALLATKAAIQPAPKE